MLLFLFDSVLTFTKGGNVFHDNKMWKVKKKKKESKNNKNVPFERIYIKTIKISDYKSTVYCNTVL